MDKEFTKIALKGIGVQTLDYLKITKCEYIQNSSETIFKIQEKFSYPIIIKPANLGSSIGISTANNHIELVNGLKLAFMYDEKVIIEKKLIGYQEFNCACYIGLEGLKVSEIEKPFSKSEILTFADKYQGYKSGGGREFPAVISKSLENKIKKVTQKIYTGFNFLGVIRIDYLYFDNKLYVNEINTVPGSLAYYLFVDTIKDFSIMLTDIIEYAVKTHNAWQSKNHTYSSNVLEIEGAKSKSIKKF